MQFTTNYDSPLGPILLAADEQGLTGLWFEGQKYFARGLAADHSETDSAHLRAAARWLDAYFSGNVPAALPPLHFTGTPFQNEVWELLAQIPYGRTTTYGALAQKIAARHGSSMSAQAVGSAVGRNPISVIVPCHRVVGATGSLTGYAGGIQRKIALLKLEQGWDDRFFVPRSTTAP